MTIDIAGRQARAKRLRDYAMRTTLRLIAAGVVLFVILRVAAPWLIDLQWTPALWLGVALILATPLVVIQLAFGLWADWRRLHGRPA